MWNWYTDQVVEKNLSAFKPAWYSDEKPSEESILNVTMNGKGNFILE